MGLHEKNFSVTFCVLVHKELILFNWFGFNFLSLSMLSPSVCINNWSAYWVPGALDTLFKLLSL